MTGHKGPKPPIEVHVLHYGMALCRFTTDLPCKWPQGHKWVGLQAATAATCPNCRRLAAVRSVEERPSW